MSAILLRVSFFFLLLGSSLSVGAQYIPTAVEGANWVLLNSNTPNYADGFTVFAQVIAGDSIVDGRHYKKLYQHRIVYVDTAMGPRLAPPYQVLPERELIGLLRDDTTNQRVYGRVHRFYSESRALSPDTLLQDYNLEVGDTVRGYYFFDFDPFRITVTEKGSINIFGAERPYLSTYGYDFYQGVGSEEYGPLSGGSYFRTNMYSYRLIDYCVGEFSDCDLVLTSTSNLVLAESVRLFPNPAQNEVFLELELKRSHQQAYLTCYDLHGRKVGERKISGLGAGPHRIAFPTADLPAGWYVLRLTLPGGSVVKQFLKTAG
ncbi:T9SS type A sorting domain-containing protein [Neolewinella lacunae]|uniref:T9SS type A sorting domain-containing protein n=1 Tax=Neolewinella lacunae TaxID=1517758 RepID=A0A923T721_9BACT|nr:T9SS type A sorting domain-containing protein [Neolewinella lacunae]MBC6994030.1 T9SS type A sorting domain-containing protein [Neolewinella lacunae]MDN3634700.1 T9SS type A sorting domain-containing protein [Neolewinella lacunae]